MNKAIRFIILAAALMPAVGLAAPEALKLGFVNIAKVMEEAPQAEEARARLESEFAPRDQELVKAQESLKRLEDKLATDGAVMSDNARHRLERDILEQRREIRRSRDEFREDFNIRRNEELRKLQERVSEAISSLARDDGYDMIFTNSVVYSSDRVEITDRILKRLREDHRRNGRSGR